MSNEPQVGESTPICQHLLSKGMFITGQRDLGGLPVGDGHCWCGKTQHSIGPDDQFVGRDKCVATRRCFQALA